MNFKEAYMVIITGKRAKKEGMKVNLNNEPVDIKYISSVSVVYMENGKVIKTDPSFLAAFDVNGGIHQLNDQNVISLLLSNDEDWEEYTEISTVESSEEEVIVE